MKLVRWLPSLAFIISSFACQARHSLSEEASVVAPLQPQRPIRSASRVWSTNSP